MKDFRKLKVWAKAHELTLEIYRVTAGFPPFEQDGMTTVLRLTASRIPANIANGSGRSSKRAFARRLSMALRAAIRTQQLLILASDLGYVGQDDYPDLNMRILEVKRRLRSLITRIYGSL